MNGMLLLTKEQPPTLMKYIQDSLLPYEPQAFNVGSKEDRD